MLSPQASVWRQGQATPSSRFRAILEMRKPWVGFLTFAIKSALRERRPG